jgi:hypothetical protein
VQKNSFQFDGRGRESSFDEVNGQPVALKYIYEYYPQTTDATRTIHLDYNGTQNESLKKGRWIIQRTAMLHLRYAEAANRAGYPDIAYALLNNGIQANYDWLNKDGSVRPDKEGTQYTGYKPISDKAFSVPYPYPFYLDARYNGGFRNPQYTTINGPWQTNYGIRTRANLINTVRPDWALGKADSIRWMEEALLTEAALELGFEGHRWGDMLRIARRKNADDGSGTAYLNAMLAGKFNKEGKATPVLSANKWFLPRKN